MRKWFNLSAAAMSASGSAGQLAKDSLDASMRDEEKRHRPNIEQAYEDKLADESNAWVAAKLQQRMSTLRDCHQ